MTPDSLTIIMREPQQGHVALTQGWQWAKAQTMAGNPVVAHFRLLEDERSLKQNAFYWGWVLKCIASQAKVNGIGADADGWHWFYKKECLGYRRVKVKKPGSLRPSYRRELRSTSNLKVKPFSVYLEKVMAHAATTYGVEFDGRRWEDWKVDPETGEILEGA